MRNFIHSAIEGLGRNNVLFSDAGKFVFDPNTKLETKERIMYLQLMMDKLKENKPEVLRPVIKVFVEEVKNPDNILNKKQRVEIIENISSLIGHKSLGIRKIATKALVSSLENAEAIGINEESKKSYLIPVLNKLKGKRKDIQLWGTAHDALMDDITSTKKSEFENKKYYIAEIANNPPPLAQISSKQMMKWANDDIQQFKKQLPITVVNPAMDLFAETFLSIRNKKFAHAVSKIQFDSKQGFLLNK